MDISLPPELARFVNEGVSSGRYARVSDLIADAVRLLQEREQERAARLEALRSDIDKGIASLERGDGVAGDEVFARLHARRRSRQQW